MENFKISIIIIAYNEGKYISGILNSLVNQTIKNFEVIVVDSNSNDETELMARNFSIRFEEFSYIKLDTARGPAFGRNEGAKIAKYDRLFFLDADAQLNSEFIERIIHDIIIKKSDVATCPVRILGGGLAANLGAYFLNMFMFLLKPVYSSAYGACFISTKEVHLKVGGFDEEIGLCEDCNYVKKARRKYHYKFDILSPYFYTSDRRAKSAGGLNFLLKYIKIHLYRMLTGNEILKCDIEYEYGKY